MREVTRVLSLLLLLGLGIPIDLVDVGSVTRRWAGFGRVLGRRRSRDASGVEFPRA